MKEFDKSVIYVYPFFVPGIYFCVWRIC